jgi:hypothetical protein
MEIKPPPLPAKSHVKSAKKDNVRRLLQKLVPPAHVLALYNKALAGSSDFNVNTIRHESYEDFQVNGEDEESMIVEDDD